MTARHLLPRSGPEIVDAAVELLRGRYLGLVALSGVVYLPYLALEVLWFAHAPAAAFAVDAATWIVSGAIVDAALSAVLNAALHGERLDAVAALRRVRRRAWVVLVAGAARWVLAAAGFVLLIVPGVWLTARLLPVSPVSVLEEHDVVTTLRRSWRLTRGAGRRLAGLAAALIALYLLLPTLGAELIAGPVTAALGAAERDANIDRVLGTIVSIWLAPLPAAVGVVAYFDQRVRRDGYDVELLARAAAVPDMPAA